MKPVKSLLTMDIPLAVPLALYIHFPWCLRKCPYCDFLSYARNDVVFDETLYLDALLRDLAVEWQRVESGGDCGGNNSGSRVGAPASREISSIYIGGGTPSLLSSRGVARLLATIFMQCKVRSDAEITIEANPDTLNAAYCRGLRAGGINRISIGVQSLQDEKLRWLGRVHDAATARRAVDAAGAGGFSNINLDLMFGVPTQSAHDAIADLTAALALSPTHLSWYQFTLEEGSMFYRQPPPRAVLPSEEELWQMQQEGQQLLRDYNFMQYEVSAYSLAGYQCQHNLNYWSFGDYLGVGSGAHGKVTLASVVAERVGYQVLRYHKIKQPQVYCTVVQQGARQPNAVGDKMVFSGSRFSVEEKIIAPSELPFEFMLNALRLYQPIPYQLFVERTGLPIEAILDKLQRAESLELLELTADSFSTTDKGKNFLNDLISIFLVPFL
jgi:putative oxygen-independent coproporphyrinogen III oxidase